MSLAESVVAFKLDAEMKVSPMVHIGSIILFGQLKFKKNVA